MLSINQSNARVLVNGNTEIDAKKDAIIGATSVNKNSVTLNVVYNAESDPAAKPPLFSQNPGQQGSGQQGTGQQGGGATTQRKKNTYALGVALGINEAQASVMLGENVKVLAGRDIVITSDVTEVLALTADANATSAGNLAIGGALNFGKAKSKTEVLGELRADGSVKVTSEVDSQVTTSSNTNLPSAGAAAIGQRGAGVPFIIEDYEVKLGNNSFNDEELFYLNAVKDSTATKVYDAVSGRMIITLHSYVVENYDQKLAGEEEFSERDKFFIWTSETADRVHDEGANTLTVSLSNDLNIKLTGGKLDLTAQDYAYIGTGLQDITRPEVQNLVIGRAQVTGANGELRLKADGNLYTADNGLIEAGYLVLEASNGDLGTLDNYLVVGKHSQMYLRAYGNMYIEGNTDIYLDGISKEKDKEARIRTAKSIIIKTDNAIVPDKTYLNAGENIIVTGHKLVDIAGSLKAGDRISLDGPTINVSTAGILEAGDIHVEGAALVDIAGSLTARDRISLDGPMIRIDASARFGYGDMRITLSDAGPDGTSSLSIGDATFVNGPDPKLTPQIHVTGQGTTNRIDASVSEHDALWEIREVGGGSFERDGVVFNFSGINEIHGSSAHDTVNLKGGLMQYIGLGSGYNTVDNQTMQNAHWVVDGSGRVIVSLGSQLLVGMLDGVSEIYGLADTLEYNDAFGIPGHWVVGQQENNGGTINNLLFNNFITTIHNSPGGTYDLYGRMDNIHLNTGPLTFIVYPGGYFYNLTFASNVSVLDLRPTHKYIPEETQVEAALRYFLSQGDLLAVCRISQIGMTDYGVLLSVGEVTAEAAEVTAFDADMVATSGEVIEEVVQDEDEAKQGEAQTDETGETDEEVSEDEASEDSPRDNSSDVDAQDSGEQEETEAGRETN